MEAQARPLEAPDPMPRVQLGARVREISVDVEGEAARVFVGGSGAPLLLVHGGWGGASLHWGPVFERLAERFAIVAPDLPGVGRSDRAPLASLGAYARWLDALLDALAVPSAWCAGNSFGASVVCRLASDFRGRCRGLVLVNGIPMPPTPPLLRWLGERPLGRRLVRRVEKRLAYSPAALKRAFADPARVPEELRRLVRAASPPQVDAMAAVFVQGGSPPPRGLPTLLLWGEDDHLPGTSAQAAKKLHASWAGSRLAFVPRAGHLPQVENPEAFVEALAAFIEGAPTPAR